MRRYTMTTVLILTLAGSVAIGEQAKQGKQRKPSQKRQAKTPGAPAFAPAGTGFGNSAGYAVPWGKAGSTKRGEWPPRVVQIDELHFETDGKIYEEDADMVRLRRAMKPQQPFPFYRIDPRDGDGNNPLPGGAADVRAVLEREKPVPADRVNYYRVLDDDPLSERYPRGGWGVYVTKVDRQAGGSWTAEIMANVWFDHARSQTGGIPRGSCAQYWVERYHWDGQTLTYLGGQPSRPGESPVISEGRL
jgi:hypothetical protein